MNRFSKTLFLVILMCSIGSWVKAEDRPMLFGFAWGTSVEECRAAGMKGTEDPSGLMGRLYPGMVSYDDANPNKMIKDVEFSSLSNNFCNGKLATVAALFKGLSDFNSLQSALVEKYGPPSSINNRKHNTGEIFERTVKWNIQGITLTLKHRKLKDSGSLVYASNKYKSACCRLRKKSKGK